MKIEEHEIYKLNYFTYNKPFTGSCGNMRYRIIRQKGGDEKEEMLLAAVYPQPFCWEETGEEDKQMQEFSFSEEGRTKMIAWLNEKLKEEEQ